MQNGDKITFGEYGWPVLDAKDDMALIITENIIDQRPYHDAYKDATWADCALRTYLNREFYDRFSQADKARIIKTTVKNLDNQWYGTKGGEDTKDYIFFIKY